MPLSRRDFLRASAGAVALGALPLDVDARLPRAQLRELRDAVRGRVYAPGNPGYDRARLVFNRRFDGIRPPAVVRVRDTADVQAVVRWAGRHDVPLVARSGGNAYNGASTSRDAVVLDVGGLDRFALDGRIATVGPGLRNIDLYTKLARRGLAIPSGSCPNVAVGGLALGGGMGLAGRGLGLLLHRVTALDVVTADGRRRRVDADSDPDLFWALRGGGGSFAVVTAVHLRARRLEHAAWFFASYPASARAELLAAWDELAPRAPGALTSICTLTGTRASAFGQHLGSEAALRRLVAPLARVDGARFSAGTSGFLALQRRWAACSQEESVAACRAVPRATFDASSVYVTRKLTARGRGAFVDAAGEGATLVLDAYGGAINQVAPDATAFVHRDARFSVQIVSYAALGTARRRVRRARAKIAPFGNGAAYQNYADLDLRSPRRAYYGANLERLKSVKAATDPEGRFAPAQGIR
jgi:FAD/FMN-containing dehydrogenase